MKKDLAKKLELALADERLVKIDRSPTATYPFDGYVVGYSDALVLVHYVDDNIYFNGYNVVRIQDIRELTFVDDDRSVTHRALRLLGERPVPLQDFSLVSWHHVLQAAGDMYPLLIILRERIDEAVCFIGAAPRLTDRTVTLREIEPGAKWGRKRRFRFDDITSVEFGGGYERALWIVSEHDRHRRSRTS